MKLLILLTALLVGTTTAGAQTNPASSFAPDSMRALVSALAHDSLEGRSTPSVALERAAALIAERFRRAGLQPGGDRATFMARYPLAVSVIEAGRAYIAAAGQSWVYGYDWSYGGGGGGTRPPQGVRAGAVVIVRGPIDSAAVARLPLRGKIVIYDMPRLSNGQIDPEGWRSVFRLGAGVPGAILLPTHRGANGFARIRADTSEHKRAALPTWELPPEKPAGPDVIGFLPFLEVRDTLLARYTTRSLEPLTDQVSFIELDEKIAIHFERHIENIAWPANVVAVLPGSDPLLKHEYIVYSAHYDGLGVNPFAPPTADRILNGADDNASGTAALLRIAQAFARERARPRRTIVFVATSGEEIGLLGSDYFVTHLPTWGGRVVANINMDMIGNAHGKLYVSASDPLKGAIAAAARVLRGQLEILDDRALEEKWPGQNLGARSDHASFIRAGIPAVNLFTGWHDRYHDVSDDAPAVDYAGLAAATRFAFALGRHLAQQ